MIKFKLKSQPSAHTTIRDARKKINYDNIAQYLISAIQIKGREIIPDELLDQLDYRILEDDKPFIRIGIFNNPSAALELQKYEYGSDDIPELGIMREVLRNSEDVVKNYLENRSEMK
jgi:hypothetical protein